MSARAQIELLWRDETLTLLDRHGIAGGVRSKARGAMWNRAAERLDAETIRRAVTDTLHERDLPERLGRHQAGQPVAAGARRTGEGGAR